MKRGVTRGSWSSSNRRHQMKRMIAIKRPWLNLMEDHPRRIRGFGGDSDFTSGGRDSSRLWLTVETCGRLGSFWSPSNGPRSCEIGWLAGFADGWHAIAARSQRDRGSTTPRSWRGWTAIMDPTWRNRGTRSPHLGGPWLSWNRSH